MNSGQLLPLTQIFPKLKLFMLLHVCFIVWQCKKQPEEALYKGGILKGQQLVSVQGHIVDSESNAAYFPAFILHNLNQGIYCFSS
jgi:hypothetical protein